MRLTVYFPEDSPTTHEFVDNKLTVGRLGDNDIVVDQVSVSSHHAEIVDHGGSVVLTDLGSTNGTFVNDEQVTGERHMQNGDDIYFGTVRALFSEEQSSGQQEHEHASSFAALAGPEPAATSGGRPGNFSYMSPLPHPVQSKDNLSIGAWAAGGVGLLAAGYSLFGILSL